MISLSDPVLGEEEKKALCATIDSGWLTMGDRVASFERAFADLHGAHDAVAVSSCTAGLHLCLRAMNIGKGDEVLVPSLTFVATVAAVLYVGATPVFVDIESDVLPHISLSDAKSKCTPKTKAVIVMHYGGYIVDLQAWRLFANSKNIALIEDAAHAPATDHVGCLSDASAFSFFSNKNMSTAEGGMVLARDQKVLKRVRRLRAHGMTTDTLTRHRGHASTYDVLELGFNYRMDELRASIGLVQLSHLPEWNLKRYELSKRYRRLLLEGIAAVSVPFTPEHKTAAHLMPVLLPPGLNKQKIMDRLSSAGIQTSIHYPPVHKLSYFRDRFPDVSLPHTECFSSREVTLPLHAALRSEDVDRVVGRLKNALSQARRD